VKLETIKERIRVGRFKPFEIHLSDGKILDVPHPDFIFFPPGGTEFIIVTDDSSFNIVAADEVTRIRLLPERRTRKPSGAS
jgi:hypothetical protein